MPTPQATEVQVRFAAAVNRGLLDYIQAGKLKGSNTYQVSHAWTEGPMLFLVYQTPPSSITCGLVSDTRRSLIDPGPWLSLEEAVRYYYLLALDENRVSASFIHPGDPTTILWSGDLGKVDLPQRVSDIPDEYRYTRAVAELQTSEDSSPSHDQPEPRRYYDPRQLEQPES